MTLSGPVGVINDATEFALWLSPHILERVSELSTARPGITANQATTDPTTGLVSSADWARVMPGSIEWSTKMACQTQNTSTVHTLREWSTSPFLCSASRLAA